ncbi:MAG: glycolate oxidase subunit GlcE [Ectothiorhodospiraceae bacterium]|jgi:glycolate oxidase FAD binding subunit
MARIKDLTQEITERVASAHAEETALEIRGGGSKSFYGRTPGGEPLEVGEHRGVVNYEPSELIMTARAGTPLKELESDLAEAGQMLAFEPPHFGGGATLGGAVAAGLSGPRRPYSGALRDMVLGLRLVNGKGEVLRFGGEVMKNVAGYDVSRLNAGAMGTLGVILDVSLKVLPLPESEHTMVLDATPEKVFGLSEQWLRAGAPLSGLVHDGERLYVRLSGASSGVEQATREIGGDRVNDAPGFWRGIRDHSHPFFDTEDDTPLWRLALPPAAGLPELAGKRLVDWGGKQLWLRTDAADAEIRAEAERLGGHAVLFRGGDRDGQVFHPLQPGMMRLHQRLRDAFDPKRILNPGRLYQDL